VAGAVTDKPDPATAPEAVAGQLEGAIAFLKGQIEVAAVMLFGSQVTGRTHEHSDIDIAVFSPDTVGLGLRGRANLAARLRLACGLELEPHFFPDTYLENPPEASFAKHIIETGRRIV